MSYLDKNLLAGEKILFRTKKHWIVFFPPVFWALVSIFLYFQTSPIFQSNSILKNFFLLPAIIALIYLCNQWLVYYFSEFAITNIRIVMREGFFFRHTNDTRLSALASVDVVQGVIGQALDYGTVFINSFGGQKDPFTDIDTPVKFKSVLQEQLYLIQGR